MEAVKAASPWKAPEPTGPPLQVPHDLGPSNCSGHCEVWPIRPYYCVRPAAWTLKGALLDKKAWVGFQDVGLDSAIPTLWVKRRSRGLIVKRSSERRNRREGGGTTGAEAF